MDLKDEQPMDNRHIIVIGGSSGASAPLRTILGALPPGLPAVFVVLHIPARSLGILTTVAQASSHLPVRPAEDGMKIEPGRVYLGVPDRHLLIVDGHIRLGRGPRENMARPAIDPLFRSAVIAYGPRVVGLLLSGFLNDGAAGLSDIKRCGGIAIVQDPEEAIADEMPLAGLRAVTADLVSPSDRIGDVLSDLLREAAGPRLPVPPEIQLEVDIAAGERVDSGVLRRFADPVPLNCPNCGGVLSQVREPGPLRFRCQVGHAVTADVLATEQENAVDEALRVALRVIEERAELVARMAEEGRNAGRRAVAEMYQERSDEYRRYADTIRRAVLMSMRRPSPSGDEGGQGADG
ncbi:chemotaxis protein CheB [Paracoccus sp. Z118]|uniref:chemotaxis protein CheB n=1 Tax=Paracoccus sp. Z118 TaxID=2851017 RepID=UPI001C2C0D0A|nr:chemotaxis protein CheB [Paracoccus sp. Z118]MBV0892617.1 chemotaxis protein CheB [Paracoccus sp. Z118]